MSCSSRPAGAAVVGNVNEMRWGRRAQLPGKPDRRDVTPPGSGPRRPARSLLPGSTRRERAFITQALMRGQFFASPSIWQAEDHNHKSTTISQTPAEAFLRHNLGPLTDQISSHYQRNTPRMMLSLRVSDVFQHGANVGVKVQPFKQLDLIREGHRCVHILWCSLINAGNRRPPTRESYLWTAVDDGDLLAQYPSDEDTLD